MSSGKSSQLDRIFQAHWAGGWLLVRFLFVFTGLVGLLIKLPKLSDAYAPSDMIFVRGIYRLNAYIDFTPALAFSAWALAFIGLLCILKGNRLYCLGLVCWCVGEWSLLSAEALHVKAFDRLFFWITLGMFFAPAGQSNLVKKWRSPMARYWMLILFSALYLSTGITKLAHEDEWLDGSAMMFALAEQYHAGGWLALRLSEMRVVCFVMCWMTILFEVLFPFLIWFKAINPWLLLIGASFHLGMLPLLNVGHFPLVALSVYPVLLHPELAEKYYHALRQKRFFRSGSLFRIFARRSAPANSVTANGDKTKSSMKAPPWRVISFTGIILFMFLGPAVKQVFGYKTPWIRQWSMFHSYGKSICDIRLIEHHADGTTSRIDRLRTLGYPKKKGHFKIPKNVKFVKGRTRSYAQVKQVCKVLGPDRDIRLHLRCGSRNGWIQYDEGEENICNKR